MLIVAAVLFLIPFYLLVRNGLSTDLEISAPDWKLFPSSLQFGNVADLFDNPSVPFLRSLRNSAIVAVLQTTGAVLVASMAGLRARPHSLPLLQGRVRDGPRPR